MAAEGTTIRELLANFGLSYDGAGFQLLDADVGKASSKLMEFGKLLASGFVANAVLGWVNQVADAADAVEKMSDAIGVAQGELQQWQYVADLAGVSNEALGAGFRKLQKSAYDAAGGGKTQSAAFRKLGVDVKDATGELKSAPELLLGIAEGLKDVTSESERTALLMEVLGRQGPRFANMLKGGAEGIAALMEEAVELGAVFSDDLIASSVAYNDNLSRLSYGLRGLKAMLAQELLPVMDRVVTWFIRGVVWIQNLRRETKLLETGLAVLGAAGVLWATRLAIAYAGPLAVFARWAAGVFLIIAVLEELWVLWEGGDTIIGRFIDKMFGPGSAAAAVTEVKNALRDLVDTYNDQWFPALEKAGEHLHRAQEDAIALADDGFGYLQERVSSLAETTGNFISDWTTGLQIIRDTLREIGELTGLIDPKPDKSGLPTAPREPQSFEDKAGTLSPENAQEGRRRFLQGLRTPGLRQHGDGFARPRPSAGALPAAPRTAPVPGGGGESAGTVVQQTNTFAITVPASGSPGATVADVKRAAREAVTEANRRALGAVTQVKGG